MNPRACLRPGIALLTVLGTWCTAPAVRAQDHHGPASTPSAPASPGHTAAASPAAPTATAPATQGHEAETATSAGTLEIDSSLETLRSQELVLRLVAAPNSTVRAGYAAGIVHRPVADIVAAIHDVDHYRDFVPQFEQSQELRRTSNSQDLFVRISVAQISHLWARLRYRDTATPDGAVVIDGHAIDGNVSRMDVRWRMTPIDGGTNTVLEFWSLVLPAIAIPIPDSLLEGEQQSAARRGVQAVRRRVEVPAAAGGESAH